MSEEDAVFIAADIEPEVADGRCHALTVGGKRCPNAALPGSLYCGIASHQALADEQEE
jgi:N utilization substance protein A